MLSKANPPLDPFGEALLNLLQNSGWSNSLQDLATSLEAADDNDPGVVRNVNLLMCKLLEIFAFANDYKLEDYAHRHELKFVMNYGHGGCAHLLSSSVAHRCIQLSLRVPQSHISGGVLTAEQLSEKLLALLHCCLPEESCERCKIKVRRTGSFSIQQGCDPDFLTIACDSPLSFSADEFNIKLSNSLYKIVTVLNWDKLSRQASVSREKSDGWWFHGVDEGQVQSRKYTDEQVKSKRHLQDVSVLMGIRVGAIGDDGECEGDHQGREKMQGEEDENGQTISSEEDFEPPLTSTQAGRNRGLWQSEVGGEDGIEASSGRTRPVPEVSKPI